MQLTRLTRHASHVIPVTSNTPNHHTGTTIQAADAYSDHDRSIATRISLNTGSARTRHTAAMRLLHAGVDVSVIALWLGHEQTETTGIYLHADLALKEKALARTTPPDASPGRYQPPDSLLAFLESL
jgi:integrase